MAKPLVSAGMVAKVLDVTPQAARRIVGELGLREMTVRTGLIGTARGVVVGGPIAPQARRIETVQSRHMPFTTSRFRTGLRAFAE